MGRFLGLSSIESIIIWIFDFLDEGLDVAVAEDIFAEYLLMKLFKYWVALLVERRLNEEDPHFLDSKDRFPDSRVILENEIEYLPEGLNLLVEGCDDLVVLPDFLPQLIPQLSLDLVVSVIVEVLGAMDEQLVGESVLVIAFWKYSVYQIVVVEGVPPICWLLRYDALQPHFIDDLILDSTHEFSDAQLKQREYVVWLQLRVVVWTIL